MFLLILAISCLFVYMLIGAVVFTWLDAESNGGFRAWMDDAPLPFPGFAKAAVLLCWPAVTVAALRSRPRSEP